MKKEEGVKDYSVIYKEKEIKGLQKRLEKTRSALVFSGASILAGGLLFYFMADGLDAANLAMYVVTGIILIVLGTISKRKPLRRLWLGVFALAAFWIADILLDKSEMILRDNGLKMLVLSILLLAMKPAKEAEIIRKDLHLS